MVTPYQKKVGQQVDRSIDKIKELLDSGHSVAEISKILNLGYSAVYNGVKRHQLNNTFYPLSKTRQKQFENAKQYDISKEELHQFYHEEKLTLKEIAKKYNCNAVTILNRMREYGISTRSKSEANNLSYEKNPDRKEHLRQLAYDGVTGIYSNKDYYQDTWIEKSFIDYCNSKNISYIRQYQINNCGHRYDFLVNTNLLVETDGDYWHNTKKQKEIDARHEKHATENGFQIIRFSDREIKKSKEECFDRIFQFIRQ